jgi:hypothetical protein
LVDVESDELGVPIELTVIGPLEIVQPFASVIVSV